MEISGEDLKEARAIAELTQAQLADRVGVHPKTIVNWESSGVPAKSRHRVVTELGDYLAYASALRTGELNYGVTIDDWRKHRAKTRAPEMSEASQTVDQSPDEFEVNSPGTLPPIGQIISRFRKAEGISIAELADRAGEFLSVADIEDLERGRLEDVTLKQIISLGNALRVPPFLFMVDMFAPSSMSPYRMPRKEVDLFSISTLKREKGLSGTRNIDLESYIRGTMILHDHTYGAAELASNLARAYKGNGAAWNRFQQHASRYNELLKGAEVEYPGEDQGFDLTVARSATEVFRWHGVLSDLGVDMVRAGRNCSHVLKLVGLPDNANGLEKYLAENDTSEEDFGWMDTSN